MTAVLALVLALPCLYWTQGASSAAVLKEAAIERVCVPADQRESWGGTGLEVTAITEAELAARDPLPPPGVVARLGVASPTQSPWVTGNGWRFVRSPAARYRYDAPRGTGAVAAAEAAAYGADAVLAVDEADLAAAGEALRLASRLPEADLKDVADFAVVDDGSPEMGEVLNLLVRRNLLFALVSAPDPRFPFTVRLGTSEYSREEAADPSALALKIRRRLTDARRSLRIFGSEVVVGRLMGNSTRVRLHLINYGTREIGGLRVRVRGTFPAGAAYVAGLGRVELQEHMVADGATEFSIASMRAYAVVDLEGTR